MQPTPVFWPGKSHGQRSLAGYSPWDRKELDTIEHSTQHTLMSTSLPLKDPSLLPHPRPVDSTFRVEKTENVSAYDLRQVTEPLWAPVASTVK